MALDFGRDMVLTWVYRCNFKRKGEKGKNG